MYAPLKAAVLSILQVPEQPHPPSGTPGSLRIFRASEKWFRLRLALWGVKQALAVVGIVIFIAFPFEILPFDVPPPMEWTALWLGVEPTGPPLEPGGPATITWGDLETPFLYLEVLGVVLLVLGAFWSYALLRIDWELRWYMTTDRSLRIREGTWRVREKTLTLTNVQNVTVHENPVQRLLGIANVKVRTAGGGDRSGNDPHGHTKEDDLLHVAVLKHVDDAPGIRDLILSRLKRAKDAGLGDPEDPRDDGDEPAAVSAETLVAAREVLREARALRETVLAGRG